MRVAGFLRKLHKLLTVLAHTLLYAELIYNDSTISSCLVLKPGDPGLKCGWVIIDIRNGIGSELTTSMLKSSLLPQIKS